MRTLPDTSGAGRRTPAAASHPDRLLLCALALAIAVCLGLVGDVGDPGVQEFATWWTGAALIAVMLAFGRRIAAVGTPPVRRFWRILLAFFAVAGLAELLEGVSALTTAPALAHTPYARWVLVGELTVHAIAATVFWLQLRRVTRAPEAPWATAQYDGLTGLANRAQFAERLHEEAGPAAVVLRVDLDDFNTVNDKLGHHVGDALLVSVAERLRACVRQRDIVAVRDRDLVARLGGDEFAILLRDASSDDADQVAQRVREALAAPVLVEGHLISISASVSAANHPS